VVSLRSACAEVGKNEGLALPRRLHGASTQLPDGLSSLPTPKCLQNCNFHARLTASPPLPRWSELRIRTSTQAMIGSFARSTRRWSSVRAYRPSVPWAGRRRARTRAGGERVRPRWVYERGVGWASRSPWWLSSMGRRSPTLCPGPSRIRIEGVGVERGRQGERRASESRSLTKACDSPRASTGDRLVVRSDQGLGVLDQAEEDLRIYA
jgi:hypothetical protein